MIAFQDHAADAPVTYRLSIHFQLVGEILEMSVFYRFRAGECASYALDIDAVANRRRVEEKFFTLLSVFQMAEQ